MAAEHPDLLLSLGTGRGEQDRSNTESKSRALGFGRRSFLTRTWDIAANMLESILACQGIWSDTIRESTSQCRGVREYTSRYIRLDIEIPNGVPKLDSLDKVVDLENLVLRTGFSEAKEVAHRLVASCFYLKLASAGQAYNEPEGTIHIQGKFKFYRVPQHPYP